MTKILENVMNALVVMKEANVLKVSSSLQCIS